MVLLLLLLDLLYLHVVVSPDDPHALGLGHVLELLEIALDVSLVGGRVEYLYLQSHEVVSEGLQDDKHDTANYHLIHIVWVLYPDVLETDNVLPTPLNAHVLITMQEDKWNLIDQLQCKVKEYIGLKPVSQN